MGPGEDHGAVGERFLVVLVLRVEIVLRQVNGSRKRAFELEDYPLVAVAADGLHEGFRCYRGQIVRCRFGVLVSPEYGHRHRNMAFCRFLRRIVSDIGRGARLGECSQSDDADREGDHRCERSEP